MQAAMCYVHVAALVAEYLWRKGETGGGRDRRRGGAVRRSRFTTRTIRAAEHLIPYCQHFYDVDFYGPRND